MRSFQARPVKSLLFLLLLAIASPRLPAAAEDAGKLVDQALRAEAAGDNATRDRLLKAAIKSDPDVAPVRWHAGQLRQNDAWVTFDEAVASARGSKAYTKYPQRRERSGWTVVDQAALARWCQRNGLANAARAHWTVVLQLDSENRAAQKALGVTRFDGEWLTTDQARSARAEKKELETRRGEFMTAFEQLHKQLSSDDQQQIDEGLAAVEAYTDPVDLQMLIVAFDGSPVPTAVAADVEKRLLDNTGAVNEAWAADFLVARAVHAPDQAVRMKAAEALRYRGLEEYAPRLLSRLRTPTELAVDVSRDGAGNVVSRYDVYREGPAKDYEQSYRYTRPTYFRYQSAPVYATRLVREAYTIPERVVQTCYGPRRYEEIHVEAQYATSRVGTAYSNQPTAGAAYRQSRATGNAYGEASRMHYEVARQNAYQEELNARVAALLMTLTREELSPYPRDLWSWWQKQWDSDPEFREQDELSTRLGLVFDLPTGLAAGTMVQTLSGPRPIEQLMIGDEVLAKSPETGELAFKPVLEVASSNGYGIPEIRLSGGGVLGVASGQWLWSTGAGWRLPQDLGSKSVLHGLTRAKRVESQRFADAERVYNLIVADFHTFFVGANHTLAHDATGPRHTDAAVPGWSPVVPLTEAAVAQATK